MNIIEYASKSEAAIEKHWKEFGYERKTSFWFDFTIADCYGIKAVKETFENTSKNWIDNVEYFVELIMVLNHKIWAHYEKNEELANVYNTLWKKADSMFLRKYRNNEEAMEYHFRVLD